MDIPQGQQSSKERRRFGGDTPITSPPQGPKEMAEETKTNMRASPGEEQLLRKPFREAPPGCWPCPGSTHTGHQAPHPQLAKGELWSSASQRGWLGGSRGSDGCSTLFSLPFLLIALPPDDGGTPASLQQEARPGSKAQRLNQCQEESRKPLAQACCQLQGAKGDNP